jgi:hypothetical protein
MKHYCHLIASTTDKSKPTYTATCGYQSENSKEFNDITRNSVKGVDCPACLEKLKGAIVIVARG